MKYVDEFRDGDAGPRPGERIAAEPQPGRATASWSSAAATRTPFRATAWPSCCRPDVRMIHGPGCPVCVLPIGRIDQAIGLALERGAIVCTYGDTMRVPASGGLSLMKAKARGGDIRMVYSPPTRWRWRAATRSARWCSSPSASRPPRRRPRWCIRQAQREGLPNFSVLCCHVLTPSAITHILESAEVRQYGTVPIDGFIGPAHVSIVIGSAPYEHFAEEYRKPVVIAGFEPLDVMQAILMLVRQVNEGRAEVENEFTRAVTRDGNLRGAGGGAEVFELRERFEWRGLGEVPYSALKIRPAFAAFDAERRFGLGYRRCPTTSSASAAPSCAA
jgi:hydrogenase expression/formation protein HypD